MLAARARELLWSRDEAMRSRRKPLTRARARSYAHLLSHWGLVEEGSPLDLSLAVMGTANYGLYVLFPWGLSAGTAAQLLLTVASASACFSVYLLYVLKFILKDFCVVCTTFHAINFTMLLLCAIPNSRKSGSKTEKKN